LPHSPDVQKQIGVGYEGIGNALLCSGAGAVLAMPLLGTLIHRYGSRNVAAAGALSACALVPFLVTHRTLWGLCVNLLLVGVCYGCLDVAMNSHSVRVQELHETPILSGIHGWFSGGGIFGGLGAALASRFHVAPVVHLLIVSALLGVLVLLSFRHLLSSSVDQDTEGPRLVLPKGVLLGLGLFCVCAFVAEGGILDWSSLYVRGNLHASAMFGGIVTAACSGAMATGRFLGDGLLHRFGNRRVVGWGGCVSAIGLFGAVESHSLAITIVSFSIACFGFANMVPVFFKEAGNLSDIPTSSAIAAVTTCGYGGFLLGPPLIGRFAHLVSLGTSLGALGLLGLIAGLGSQFVLHDSKR
jgi:hypothetical protein